MSESHAAKWHFTDAVQLPEPGEDDGSAVLYAWIDDDDPFNVELSAVRIHTHDGDDGRLYLAEESLFRASISVDALGDLVAAATRMQDRRMSQV